MIKNYFITAFRNLIRNKVYALINILGLALGISAALILFHIVAFEKSFDTYHTHYDHIYRFVRNEINANYTDHDMGIPQPFIRTWRNDHPDLGIVTQTMYSGDGMITVANKMGGLMKFREEEGIAFADREFFRVFDFGWVAGDQETALDKLHHVVLSESLVGKYFGLTGIQAREALGREITLDNELRLTVSGVMRDVPENSDLPFTAIITYGSLEGFVDFYEADAWHSVSSNTNGYLLLNAQVAPDEVVEKLRAFGEKYLGEEAEFEKYLLQPLHDIHFSARYDNYNRRTISPELLLGPVVIGLFLIFTACINFVNLATAQAVRRAKEVGIRKVLGGSKRQLIVQFLGETFLITIIAVIISLGITELGLNRLEWLMDYNLTIDLTRDFSTIGYLTAIIFGVTLLAGLYPAFILSSLNPLSAMKQKLNERLSGKLNLRRGLVVFQFFISQLLIICTLVVISQMEFFKNADLGFRKDSIITFALPERDTKQFHVLKHELLSHPNVEKVSFSLGAPRADSNLGSNFSYAPLASENDFDAYFKVVDADYFDLFELELLAGRKLNDTDTLLKTAVATESIMRLIGVEDPQEMIGLTLKTGFNGDKRIVGVVRDFYARSLKHEQIPLFMVSFPGIFYQGAVRFVGDEQDFGSFLDHVEARWLESFPDYLFEYSLFEERILEDYESEADILTLFEAFSGIAILIGCLGLYGLIAFIANQKIKEIGVRKVLGASVMQILGIFSREMLVLIFISFLLAGPVGYFVMDHWLQDFEFRISIQAWVFMAAVGFTILIGMITAGFRSFRAARANPADSLRTE